MSNTYLKRSVARQVKTGMKHVYILLICVAPAFQSLCAQSLYFPPVNGDEWESRDPGTLGWCQERIDSMYAMLEDNHTKAFIVLQDGRIVLEKYFGTFRQDSLWYWASAGKSLTACLVGLARQEGFLSLDDPASAYLGDGWTACTPDQESAIRVLHQLTMTSGLDDGVPDPHCTIDSCLVYKAEPATRWAYHNAPYTLLDGVVENATGTGLNLYFQQKIRPRTGINGLFLPLGYNNVFFSQARSMARFGLWMLNKGVWNGDAILTDTAFVHQMMNTSQSLNLSYGYLWWLNGKPSYMLPGLQFVFPGSLMPDAPDDMVMALGKNGQYVNVVPGLRMVVIRMGNAPDGNEVPVTLNNVIWQHLNGLDCQMTHTRDVPFSGLELHVSPVPGSGYLDIKGPDVDFDMEIFNMNGVLVYAAKGLKKHYRVTTGTWPAGLYWVRIHTTDGQYGVRKVIWTP